MLKDKNALITGSTSGIGWGIASTLAKAGCNVILNGFGDPQDIEEKRHYLESSYSIKALYVNADVSEPSHLDQMTSQVTSSFGNIDILVNNAGIQYVSPIETFPIDRWNAIMAINLTAAFHLIRLTLSNMKNNRWGRIINICSAHGLVASPYKSAYVAAKHGLLGLTKTVALEAAEYGVTCNAICPGYVLTPLVEGQIVNTAQARGISKEAVISDVMLGNHPTKQFIKIEEVANLALFLCGESAASITGASLVIDGGWTAH